ncbi:hypothetical protein Q5P01_013434 [Channa striata]|uniref:Protein SIX6OS1 n=1 Tax=Channa striata TaxID=64152 RepID=A0AA88MMU7_CHASR|nr:hypothetical protein Q5P01_013434 [Channa striata]
MNDHFSLQNIDSLIFQFALQTRELTHEKNELNKQIKVCKADIAERKSYIESMEEKIKKLEEEIRVKQDIVIHNKENAKSMKATNSLLLQYEQTLKAELNSRQASYNHDMEVSEERIASYRKILQSHKECYYQNPLAQKLLMLQAEKEEIECRIKAVDEQVTIKQKELDRVTDPAANCSSAETLIESISGQQPITELEKQLDPLIVESSDLSNSFLHLSQTKNGHTVSVKANEGDILEEKRVQNNKTFSNYSEEASSELEKTRSEEMYTSEQEKKTKAQDQVLELVTPASEINEPVEDKVEERVILDENQAPNNEDNEGLTGFPQSTNPSSPAKITAASSNPTFPFNFSPASSPHQGTSVRKSPTFLFSLISDPSTPSFSGFDVGSSQNEDTSFTFHSSFFSDKKAAVSKVLNSPGFLFDQSDQSEDFQFDFTSKSPQATKKDNNRDEFPFSLNF